MELQQTFTTDLRQIPTRAEHSADLVAQAARAEIVDTETYGRGGDLIRAMTDELKLNEDARTKLVKPLNDHVKWINSEFKKITEPLTKAIARVRGLMQTHADRVEQMRIENEKALQKKRDDNAMEQANKLERMGHHELADAVLVQAASAPVVDTRMDTVRGDVTGATSSTKKVWKLSIDHLYVLVQHLEARKIIENDEKAMDRIRIAIEPYVKAQHALGKTVPGTTYKQVTQVAVS